MSVAAYLTVSALNAHLRGRPFFVPFGSVPGDAHWTFLVFCRQYNGCRCHWGAA